jgi:NAD-dependent SIR2 family protein deacetylase
MKNEPVLKLAMSMHANPGVYALLIGSGVSRAAGIPTGWEIVLKLIRQMVAAETMKKEDLPSDLKAWYQQRFDEVPDYSKLLDRLTTTSAERMALLCSCFEPNEEDREQGLKIPTPAHQAIATLAKLGYVRMILTTNFDRLIEKALDEEGIVPDVISSDYDLKEVMPYAHSRCVVVKLHGDYRHIHIKNTPEELANYSQELNNFLDRVFDEFGLVVCGWSSEWDIALREAILRAPARRFTTFWLAKGELIEEAENITHNPWAEVIPIEDADQFFTELLEKVESLRELERYPPISTAVAVATVKRYLVEPHHIRLRDLVHEETERVYQELLSERFDPHIGKVTEEVFQQRLHKYNTLVGRLMAMLTALSYHDTGANAHLLTGCIKRLAQVPRRDGKEVLVKLQYYPALLLTYAAGISAITAKRFHNLAAVLKEPEYRDFYNYKQPAIAELNIESVFMKPEWLPNRNALNNTPNDYLSELLRPALYDYLPDDTIYEETFNIFEYLIALTYLDIVTESHSPHGRFENRVTGYTGTTMRCDGVVEDNWDRSPPAEFVAAQGGELLKENFFDGSIERFKEVVEIHKKLLENQTWGRI